MAQELFVENAYSKEEQGILDQKEKERKTSREYNENMRTNRIDTTTVPVVTENDILFGQSRDITSRPANKHYAENVNAQKQRYKSASANKTKNQITLELVRRVTREGHRFLENKDGKWYNVSEEGVTKWTMKKLTRLLNEERKRKRKK